MVLAGDLSPFSGTYSSDTLEKAIADSGFTLFGYLPEEYRQNQTTVFPVLSKGSNGWTFWDGTMHAEYELYAAKPVTKTAAYYTAPFVGSNTVAIIGQEVPMTLVPPGVRGPNGSISDERRIFFGANNQSELREYHDGWWKKYS